MTGRLSDLNTHLFAAIDRLAAPQLAGTALEDEVTRAEAIVKVADQITANHRTALAAAGLFAQHGAKVLDYLPSVGPINARAPTQIQGTNPTQIEGRAEK